jgi:hypothetical protein
LPRLAVWSAGGGSFGWRVSIDVEAEVCRCSALKMPARVILIVRYKGRSRRVATSCAQSDGLCPVSGPPRARAPDESGGAERPEHDGLRTNKKLCPCLSTYTRQGASGGSVGLEEAIYRVRHKILGQRHRKDCNNSHITLTPTSERVLEKVCRR